MRMQENETNHRGNQEHSEFKETGVSILEKPLLKRPLHAVPALSYVHTTVWMSCPLGGSDDVIHCPSWRGHPDSSSTPEVALY